MSLDDDTQIEALSPEQQRADIKERIGKVVDQVGSFYNMYIETRKTVKADLEEIVSLGINQYQMQPIELRDLIDETFAEKKISPSYLRKLLPDVLKMTSKTNKRYLTDESEEGEDSDEAEYRGKIDLGTSSGQTTSITGDYSDIAETVGDVQVQQPQGNEYVQALKTENKKLKQKIKAMEEIQDDPRLEIFTAKAICNVRGNEIPVVVTVDPKKQSVSVEVDEAAMRNIVQSNIRSKKKE